MSVPLSVTSARICCPPQTPFANLSLVSTGALLTVPFFVPQEPLSPRIASKQTAIDVNVSNILLIYFLQFESGSWLSLGTDANALTIHHFPSPIDSPFSCLC